MSRRRTYSAHESQQLWTGHVGTNLVVWALLLLSIWTLFPKKVGQIWILDGIRQTKVALPWFGQREVRAWQFGAQVNPATKSICVRADDCVEEVEKAGLSCFSTQPKSGLHCTYVVLPLRAEAKPEQDELRFTIRNLEGES